ncbi:MAG: ATP-binding protein [Blastocatellia bacterium]|nr:ATP-binding protein [Blastocatellia bacterium]
MTVTNLVDQLAEHKTLGSAPQEELAWLASHGTVRHLQAGDVLTAKGTPVEGLFVLLNGHVAIFFDQGGGRRKVMEWRAGDVMGLLPYSRLVSPPGDTVAQVHSVILTLHRDHLTALIRNCHQITSILVHKMIDRARLFTSSALQDEKMASLGKLSAGLAHELNNPVAAIERSASLLDDHLEDAERATRALGAARLTDTQFAAIDEARASCQATRAQGVLSPIQQAEREDAIADWLAAKGLDESTATTLAETAVTIEALDRLAAAVSGPSLDSVLRWAAAGCSVRGLAWEIQEAAMRISGLVQAIKGFTHMDQAPVAEPVDLRLNLGNTVTVLKAKARAKSIAVVVTVEPDLPPVRGFVGELNQVWANLIDNALDAAPEAGCVEVTAHREQMRVLVRVVDNGPGIPAEVRARIFEPFFTTKPVGLGTGLGLDIVRRLVIHNEAEINVESEPGRTEFRVSLPIAEKTNGAGGRS